MVDAPTSTGAFHYLRVSTCCDGTVRGGAESRRFTEPQSTGRVRLLEGQPPSLP